MNNLNIQHDLGKKQFFVRMPSGRAYLSYKHPDDGTLELVETFVPKQARNSGVASKLAEHVLELAEEQQLKIEVNCPFVASFIEDHPEYQKLVVGS
jgi:hypothetical protein